ncbi:MAG: sigma 54-interacting transcriptional regulator [Myxococcales bacterium]|nr:sigma 54-interacting transcriptional regulator [Myxococcales bacterium]
MRERRASGRRRERAVDYDSVLMAVSELVRREIDLDILLAKVIDAVTAAMAADRGTIFLIDRQRGELFSKAGYYPEVREIRLEIGQGIAGHVARSGETVILGRDSDDPRLHRAIDRATGYATQSVLCVPVRDSGGEVLGVIQLLNKQGADFDERDAGLLRALASQVAMVIETTSLYRQLRGPTAAPLAYRYNGIVGQSPAMLRIYEVVAKAAATDATVLVTGETGTGKGAIARAIHYNSPRRERPFVAVDCASLPATLIENELFGHERGAFTGADQRSVGKFEAADGGTVFLDEIGELPLPLQGKLLRILQERAFERVGGRRTLEVDVRIVAATNRDLEEMVARRLFREDLYYRLRVVALHLPALRERGPVDLEMLAAHFLDRFARRHGRPFRPLTPAALARLRAHTWPGNIRELENCIESAVVLADGPAIDAGDLPMTGAPAPAPLAETGASSLAALTWDEMERLYIGEVLRAHGGNRSRAAKAMGIGRTTLIRKIRELAVAADEPPGA